MIILVINFAGLTIISAQPKISNKYGLIIIYGTKILQKEIAEVPANEMLNIKRSIRGIELDLNCTGWWHYYLPNSSSFQLLDISFAEVRKMERSMN